MQGIFITFEGPDGAGKTSVLKEVSERLAKESKRKLSPQENQAAYRLPKRFEQLF